jgi:hypothetical protein
MKLARTKHSIVPIGTVDHISQRRGQYGSNILPQSNSDRPYRISRPSGELVARWYVSPETGRIECRWLLEQPPTDDYLCAGYMRTTRRLPPLSRRSLFRRRPTLAGCHKFVSERMIIGAQRA